MFNVYYSGILTSLVLVYLVQTSLVFLLLSFSSHHIQLASNNVNTRFNDKLINFFMYCIVFFFAGVPPFFMFFIKILVFTKFASSSLVFTALFLLNTIILSYYLNFIYKLTESRQTPYTNTNYKIQFKVRSIFIHVLFFNFVSIFLLPLIYHI